MAQAIIIAVIAALGGGFLVKLLTVKADNRNTEELTNNVIYDGWKKLYDAQSRQIEDMRKEISDLREKQMLFEKVNMEYKRIIALAYGCSHKEECPIVKDMAKNESCCNKKD